MKYASAEKFQQISVNTLAFTAFLTIVYAICALGNLSAELSSQIGLISAILLALGQTVYAINRAVKIMKFVSEAIK